MGRKSNVGTSSFPFTIDKSKDIKPMNHVRPYDVPYNLRASMDKELSEAISAGVLSPCNEATSWTHQLFPVPKHRYDEVRLVSDFRCLNAV